MLVIRADLVEQMVAHARRDHPDEACGILAGPEGADRPERFVPMLNAARSMTFYEFEPTEMQRVYLEMDRRDEWSVVIYHSHTATEAYPSRTDVAYASGPLADPRVHHVLVSTRDDAVPNHTGYDLHSYRVVDGEVTEEEVQVVENYMFAHTGAADVPDQADAPSRD